jgi:hypothetical protein
LRKTLKVWGEFGEKIHQKMVRKGFFFQGSDLSFMFHGFFNGHSPGMHAKRSIDGLDMGIHRIISDFPVRPLFPEVVMPSIIFSKHSGLHPGKAGIMIFSAVFTSF